MLLAPLSNLRILTMLWKIYSKNRRFVQFKDGWQMGLMELLTAVTCRSHARRLSFRFSFRSSCLTMLISQSWWMRYNNCYPEWKIWIKLTINSSSPPIAWGASQLHCGSFTELQCRLFHQQPQLFLVQCLHTPLERWVQLYFLKINTEVNLALLLWSILLWKPLLLSLTMLLEHFIHFLQCNSDPMGVPQIPVHTPLPNAALFYLVVNSSYGSSSLLGWALLNPHRHSCDPIGGPYPFLLFSARPHGWVLLNSFRHLQDSFSPPCLPTFKAVLCWDRDFSIPISAPLPGLPLHSIQLDSKSSFSVLLWLSGCSPTVKDSS